MRDKQVQFLDEAALLAEWRAAGTTAAGAFVLSSRHGIAPEFPAGSYEFIKSSRIPKD